MTRLGILLCALRIASSSASAWTPTPHGAVVSSRGWQVELAVEGLLSFRLSARRSSTAPPQQVATTMVSNKTAFAEHNVTSPRENAVRVSSAFGSVELDIDTGAFTMRSNSGSVLSASAAPLLSEADASSIFTLAAPPDAYFTASGTDGPSATTLARTSGVALVGNTMTWTPSFWCSAGWSMLAVSPLATVPSTPSHFPVSWAVVDGSVTISIGEGSGTGVDVYLTPAADLRAHARGHVALVGAPVVPPRFAFGFIACRWGWESAAYMEDVIKRFRSLNAGLDVVVSDFEWFTSFNDYQLPPTGAPNYSDFGYNPVVFPPPAGSLIKHYMDAYGVRFGGIRKPRLGNTGLLAEARSHGWMLGQGADPAGIPDGTRNLNYSIPALRTWYAEKQSTYVEDGVAMWWDDEGEEEYNTFSQWTIAHEETIAQSSNPTRRLLALNRAFAPGDASRGAVVWTGDIKPTYEQLARSPAYAIHWGLSGQPFVACDTGGFEGNTTALLLARWYGVSTFMPLMRIHSRIFNPPHFPFPEVWGEDASDAMRAAIARRYTLLPHLYSLAHALHSGAGGDGGLPLIRPMAMEFPDDTTGMPLLSQWLIGSHLLVAPVLTPDNATSVYLPEGVWFEYDTPSVITHTGPVTLSLTSVPLATVPSYARSGAIFTLAPPGVMSSEDLPGGPLAVTIYGGEDGAFVFVEDDGETTAYATTAASLSVSFLWDDAKGCLSWTRAGAFGGDAHSFTTLTVHVFTLSGRVKTAPAGSLGASGNVCPT